MDFRKLILYAALVGVSLTLWNLWQREQLATIPNITTIKHDLPAPNNILTNSSVPSITGKVEQISQAGPTFNSSTNYIKVTTDTLDVLVDKQGGNIIQNELLLYPQKIDQPQQPFVLLTPNQEQFYISQSGLTGTQGPDTQKGQVKYSSTSDTYTLKADQAQLTVDLSWENKDGLQVIKRYTFYRGKYVADVNFIVHNSGQQDWTVYPYAQLQRKEPAKESPLFHYGLFTGAAISSPKHHYKKLSFGDMKAAPLNENISDGWAAMVEHYFLTAWIPPIGKNYHYYSSRTNNNIYTVGMLGSALTIAPQQTANTGFKLYSGPAVADNLKIVAPYLDLTIDYGWLWFISAGLLWVMKYLYQIVGNWGWSVILLTLLIKLCFYHLSAKSYASMAHMRRLQPHMQQLKERFSDDKPKLSQAMMEMYRTEKVNPLSGCLPIVVQIPVFIALYYMIIETIELRQAPFVLWIHDLSVADPFYILPVIMGGLMFIQQKLNPPAPDPMQQKIMMFLPVIFTVFFLTFPAGLVLYWITNTALSILQQWWIMRQVNKIENVKKRVA